MRPGDRVQIINRQMLQDMLECYDEVVTGTLDHLLDPTKLSGHAYNLYQDEDAGHECWWVNWDDGLLQYIRTADIELLPSYKLARGADESG